MESFTTDGEFREAQRLGRLGSWSWRLSTNEIVWSEELYRIFGFDRGSEPPPFERHREFISAESWPRLAQAVDRLLAEGLGYCVEVEYRTPTGDAGWAEARGEPIRDADGAIVGLRGTCQEITERVRRVRAEVELQLEVRAKQDRATLVRRFSEQIRTALNGVSGFAALLRAVVEHDPQQLRWVNRIAGASDEIVGLLKGIEQIDDLHFAGSAAKRLAPDDRRGFGELVESVPFPALVHDRRGNILHVNRRLVEATGYSAAELPTRAEWAARAYRDEDAADIASQLRQAFAGNTSADGGCRWVHTKDGRRRRWHLLAAPSGVDDTGEPIFISLGIDVTDPAAPPAPVEPSA